MCGQICYYKTTLKQIKRTALTDPEIQWNVNSLPLSSNSDIRKGDDIQVRNTISGSRSNILSSRDFEPTYPFHHNVRVRNTNINKTYDYSRADNTELVLAQQRRKNIIASSAQILESDRIGSDLTVSGQSRKTHHQTISKQMDIEFTDEPGFVDPRDLVRRRFQPGFQRSEPNLSSHENLIEPNTPRSMILR